MLDPGHELEEIGSDTTAESVEATPVQDTTAEPTRETLRRALRELEAAESRVLRTAERVYDDTRSRLVSELLPVLDNLDRTITAAEEHSARTLIDGAKMVRNQLEGVLSRYGVERVDATGMRFDPEIHEAIDTVPVTDLRFDGMVLQQAEPGYRFGSTLLRPARVNVGVLQKR